MSVTSLLEEYKEYLELTPSNRIKCKVTGHEMPINPDIVSKHVQSKKFKNIIHWYSQDYSEYLPLIVPHKSDQRKLFCTLTRKVLNKIPEEIVCHVNGKRFKRLKQEYEEKQKNKANAKQSVVAEEDADIWIPDDDVLDEPNNDDRSDVEEEEFSENDSQNSLEFVISKRSLKKKVELNEKNISRVAKPSTDKKERNSKKNDPNLGNKKRKSQTINEISSSKKSKK